MSAIDVELISVSKSFGPISVVTNIDLKIPKGEFVSILGPSGCGKTTTLNMIAGFSAPSGGDIRIRGRSQVDVPPERRNIGLVFGGDPVPCRKVGILPVTEKHLALH